MDRASGAALATLAIALPTLAGCLGGAPGVLGPPDADPPAAAPAALLHRASGDPIDAAEAAALFPALPAGAARYLGTRAFEPTLGVDAQGRLFMSAFSRGRGEVYRSDDRGATWTNVTPILAANVAFPPQSNDPFVHVDAATGRVFTSDLQALLCSTLSYSDDQGATWVKNPVGCGLPFGVHDHQSVFTAKPRLAATVAYPNVVYYCVNRVVDSACAASLDGGLTFGPLRPAIYAGLDPGAAGEDPAGFCGGLTGHGASAPDGTVYLPKGHCGRPVVSYSRDDGLTWTPVVVNDAVGVKGHEVAVAADEAGHAFAFWIGADRKPYLAASPDGGVTWNPAVRASPPDVNVTDFPTIAAGADGRVAMAYYGTGREAPYNKMDGNDTWNAYLTIATDALAADPVFATVAVNDPADPAARGACGNTRCNGVGDFIDVVVDPDGRPFAALVDVCNDNCTLDTGKGNYGVRAFVGTLETGPALRGPLGPLAALPPAPPPK